MSERIHVATEEEFTEGERKVIETGTREIGVLNMEGEYYAIENACAHMGGPLCKGKVQGALVGRYTGPGERVKESFSDDLAIACPLHGWEYDLETGVHLGDDDIQLQTYDVIVEDGDVYVEK